ncbi:MAG TPA: hypothetical protein VJ953_21725 [Saprospiraceae bacterium]|nr:hypothetical protein [Saprospiraceae bacterium]
MNRFINLNQDLHHFKKDQTRRLSKASSYFHQQMGDPVEMPPMEVTIPKRRRERILRKAGWKKATLIIVLKDFLNRPLLGYKVMVESQAPNVVPQYDGKDVKGGGVIFSDFWIKPSGILRVMAVSTGAASLAPSGTIHYTLPRNNVLKLEANQGSKEVEVVATSSAEAASKSGAKGTAGVDYKILKIGGEISAEESNTRGESVAYRYKVILPAEDLNINVVQ